MTLDASGHGREGRPVPGNHAAETAGGYGHVQRGLGWRGGRLWVLLVGFLAWCALAVGTLVTARGSIEDDLTLRAQDVLERTGETWASVHFNGRDALLEGESLAEMARAKVRNSLADMFGVRAVHDATTLLPERRPFTFSAVKDGKVIALSGYVPSVNARARILSAIESGGYVVAGADKLVRARGAPPGDFAALVLFGLKQLEQLPAGRITLSDGAIAIEGRASDLTIHDELGAAMRGALPYGMTLARFAVRPPVASPFLWSASREGKTLRLSGYVPSETASKEVLSALEELLPGLEVHDDTHLADGAPSTDLWLKAVRYAAGLLAISPQLQVSLSDSALSVEGQAPTFDSYDALSQARRNAPEGFQVTRFAVEPPRASPFTWMLERNADGVRLVGYAPSEETRRLLNDAVRSVFPGVPIRDEMRLASGGPAPEAWAAAANYAVAQLARLSNGQVQGEGTRLALTGEALDSAGFTQISKAVKSPPNGVTVISAVKPPHIAPYVFAVRRDQGSLTISGFYPDEKAHDVLLETLSRDFLKEKVTDVSAIGSGAPEGFLAVITSALSHLARLENGELSLADTQIHLSGTALSPQAAEQIASEMRAVIKPPFTVDIEIGLAQPGPRTGAQECQALITDLMGRSTILFNSNSAQITHGSRSLLDRMAYVLERCPAATVIVEGHTDTVGDSRTNQRLSQARAQSVVKALEEVGIAPARLSAVGYGVSRPVASNDTEVGRARNRRIELIVQEGPAQ